jgi:hypothetical protein
MAGAARARVAVASVIKKSFIFVKVNWRDNELER